ncbi:hypothetical protein VOLCADRAFT_97823 [Volvox carteri f. nagariensis]|uniref:Uncharacterized protein n=1 Tax=Volvox carteri f. nagariensis TaxID=3068 RepID=D8UDQ6_VOLCA|nr:uncharacterized protein VOLCADRAFT_97823 [Volvox carteri f. nagariensis]EFJ42136.1 hypothetical protein VOLCADRAFT_97823 [Volvox carteri f. nagariensis]|eukprot:XP_002956833.1 hypothetical protein VOLCADRAFT_97823 [Volvox carteri f. nagariensis]
MTMTHITTLLSAAAAAAAYEGLMDEHAVHLGRGMHAAAAACVLTGAVVLLPYRWRTCRPQVRQIPLWRMRLVEWRDARQWWRCQAERGLLPSAGLGLVPEPRHQVAAELGLVRTADGSLALPAAAAAVVAAVVVVAVAGGRGVGGGGGGGGGESAHGNRHLPYCFVVPGRQLYWAATARRRRQVASSPSSSSASHAGSLLGGSPALAPQKWLSPPPPPPPLPKRRVRPLHDLRDLSMYFVRECTTMFPSGRPLELIRSWRRRQGGFRKVTPAEFVCKRCTTAMWRSSAWVLLVHSPAWVVALAAMGGSSMVWLALQLTWHAALPYIFVESIATAEDLTVGAVAVQPAVAADNQGVDDDDVATKPGNRNVSTCWPVISSTAVQEYGPYKRGRKRQTILSSKRADDPCTRQCASGEDNPNSPSDTKEGFRVANGNDDGNVGSVRETRMLGCGLLGRRPRLSPGSILCRGFRFMQPAGFGSGSRSRAEYGRSEQPSTTVHRSSDSSMHLDATDGSGGAGSCTARVQSSTAPSCTATASAMVGSTARFLGSLPSITSGPPLSLPAVPMRQESLSYSGGPEAPKPLPAALATASIWVSVASAAVRRARPLLAALWLYGGPFAIGAVPVLPRSWLWDYLAASPAQLAIGLVLAVIAVAWVAAPAFSKKGNDKTVNFCIGAMLFMIAVFICAYGSCLIMPGAVIVGL